MKFKTQSDRPNIKDNLGVVIDIVLKLITRLDNESKISLKMLLTEIEKVHTKIINIFSQFNELDNDSIFQDQFASRYHNFKKSYEKNLEDVEYNCDMVKKRLDNLIENHKWNYNKFEKMLSILKKNNSNVNNKLLENLKNIINDYYSNNKIIYKVYKEIQKNLDLELNDINSTFNKKDVTTARMKLQLFFQNSEYEIEDIRQLLKFLNKINNYL